MFCHSAFYRRCPEEAMDPNKTQRQDLLSSFCGSKFSHSQPKASVEKVVNLGIMLLGPSLQRKLAPSFAICKALGWE